MKKIKKRLFRYSFLVVIFLMLGWFLSKNLTEIRQSFDTTVSSLTGMMFMAFLVILVSMGLYVVALRKIFQTGGAKYKFWEMFNLQLSALAVNIIIPTGGASGAVIYADDYKDKGFSRASAIINYFILVISEYTAISILLLASIVYLFLNHSLGARVYLPAGIFIGLTAVSYYLMFQAANKKSLARRGLTKLVGFISAFLGHFLKKKYQAEGMVEKVSEEALAAKKFVKEQPRFLFVLIGIQLIVHLLRMVALFLIFYSLGYQITANVLLAGYIIGMVLVVVSPTPSGVGFVEGAMYLMYTSLGVPGAVASTATIIYRFMQFWLPFFVGMIMLQQNRIKRIKMEMETLKDEE